MDGAEEAGPRVMIKESQEKTVVLFPQFTNKHEASHAGWNRPGCVIYPASFKLLTNIQ